MNMFWKRTQIVKRVALGVSCYIVFCTYVVSKFPFSAAPGFQPAWYQNSPVLCSGFILGLPAHIATWLLGKISRLFFMGTYADTSVFVNSILGLMHKALIVIWGIACYHLIMRFASWRIRKSKSGPPLSIDHQILSDRN